MNWENNHPEILRHVIADSAEDVILSNSEKRDSSSKSFVALGESLGDQLKHDSHTVCIEERLYFRVFVDLCRILSDARLDERGICTFKSEASFPASQNTTNLRRSDTTCL